MKNLEDIITICPDNGEKFEDENTFCDWCGTNNGR